MTVLASGVMSGAAIASLGWAVSLGTVAVSWLLSGRGARLKAESDVEVARVQAGADATAVDAAAYARARDIYEGAITQLEGQIERLTGQVANLRGRLEELEADNKALRRQLAAGRRGGGGGQ